MSTQAEPSASSSPRSRKDAKSTARTATVPVETPRTGAKRTVMDTIRQLPAYLRLLAGLLTDRRVAGLDKLLVAGAMLYIVSPLDMIPDFIPFLGEIDDIYLLVLALERLISNAGRRILADHWAGDIEALGSASLRRVLMAAAFFLPRRIRRRLRAIGRG